jgi:predicted nuclease of predicted toxin-antitoxin system
MRFLLDQGLGRGTVAELVRLGHSAVHVGDLGMAAATDEAILERGRLEGAVVVTLDTDFHAILARTGARAPSTIRLRIEGLKAAAAAELIDAVEKACSKELGAGVAVSVDESSIRVRPLPLPGGASSAT